MENIKISMVVGSNSPSVPLGLTVLLDGNPVWSSESVGEKHQVEFEFSDEPGDHVLELTMSGKLPEHTTLDGDVIVSDALLYAENFVFDDLEVTHFVQRSAQYKHDCNGTQAMQSHPFYRDLGCNGTVQLKFTAPFYLWILEQI